MSSSLPSSSDGRGLQSGVIMSDEVFEIRGVSYSYGDVTALSGVSFTVGRGDCLAVLGASGAGKTTLMKIISGLVTPAAGTVDFMGSPLAGHWLKKGHQGRFRAMVGFVFPEPDVQLFCETVTDEVAFGPLQLGLSPEEVRRRVADTMEMLGITGLGGRPPHRLSSGEKKKVQIASVLSVNPEVILLDEPTFGLDPRTQVWLLEILLMLKDLGKTFILSTHDLSLVEDFSERAIVLDELHRLAADGPSQEILRDRALLLRVNLIHEHAHRHGTVVHIHSHGPSAPHDEH